MTEYTRFDKIVSDALHVGWQKAEDEGDGPGADAFKRALSHLGLPWVPIGEAGKADQEEAK